MTFVLEVEGRRKASYSHAMVDPEVRISAIAVAEDLTSDYVEMAEASTSQSATSCKTAPSASNTPTAPAPASPCHRRAIIVSTHPGQGTVKRWKQISGNYYQVNPLCLRSKISVLTDNARCVVWISTGEFCEVFFVAIDATYVGTVE